MAAGVCLPTKARWYPWNTLNLMSLTSWCCANALWILNYSTQFYVCNKSSIKTCKDFGIEQQRRNSFSALWLEAVLSQTFFFFVPCVVDILSCGFLSHGFFLFPKKKANEEWITEERNKSHSFDVFVWENFFMTPFFPGFLLDSRRLKTELQDIKLLWMGIVRKLWVMVVPFGRAETRRERSCCDV